MARSLFEFVERAMQGYGTLSCAEQSVGEIEELGRNPIHVLAWKASGKGWKPWNGKGAGKGKKSGQEKGKTQPQTSKGKIKGKISGKGKYAKSRPSHETGKDKGNSKKGFTSGESSDDWKSARRDSTSHTNARDTYVVSSTLWLQLECPVCTDVTNGIALKRQFIFDFPRRGRCASWIHVKLPVYLVLCLGGRNARCQTPFQRQRTTRSESSYPSQSRH